MNVLQTPPMPEWEMLAATDRRYIEASFGREACQHAEGSAQGLYRSIREALQRDNDDPYIGDWNDTSQQQRADMIEAWHFESCPHDCSGSICQIYGDIGRALTARERRIFAATMEMPT